MAGYQPLKITGMKAGLVQDREEFILPNDAYPILQNAYVWRERILRKKGFQYLGRLQRSVTVSNALSGGSLNLKTALSLEASATIVSGTISLTGSVDGTTYTDPGGTGTLTATGGSGTGGTINYATGVITINSGGTETLAGTIQYYPGLPVMGIRTQDVQNAANDITIVFDQKYAYKFNGGTGVYAEFIPGTTWNAHNGGVTATDFFWSTNYWVSSLLIPNTETELFTTANVKLFWVTNNTGQFFALADPPRITDGTTWVDFYDNTTPTTNSPWAQIDATTFLTNFLSMLPFRGRMLTFNTWEGANAGASVNFPQRIRWSTIGNPFLPYHNGDGTVEDPNTGSWRDDIRGQGGFLDIPTSEDIIAVGFVRDNLVIYCERSTWQLRYTGRSIAPFQIERVNSELGAEGPFSAVQFDTSLIGIGDKGIVECDSYKSQRIDIKIPDFVFQFQGATVANNNPYRVHGIRDFENRLAFWTCCVEGFYDGKVTAASRIFPNVRLVYNYENDSWATFTDSLTTLGTFQPPSSRTWLNTPIPWVKCNFPWISQPAQIPLIIGGNQQGFVFYLDELTVNDSSLYISAITGFGTATGSTAAIITSPNHNLVSTNNIPNNVISSVIGISGIPTGTPFASLNGGIYGISVIDQNTFNLYTYNTEDEQFNIPVTLPVSTYIGDGLIYIRENFSITSKKFNFIDEGQNIQMGYVDVLMSATGSTNPGAITLNVYLDYNDSTPSNTFPQNQINNGDQPSEADTFFNSVIPTNPSSQNTVGGTKFWQRVFCATRANFLSLQYTFSNAQLAGTEQELNVQIDAQILWLRKAGRITQI